MKKNGFTVVELVISIALLSVVMIFMMNLLVDLKSTEEAKGVDTKLLVNQYIISKAINSDFTKMGVSRIDGVSCSDITNNVDANNCYKITFNTGDSKYVYLFNSNKSLFYGKDDANADFRRTLAGGNTYESISKTASSGITKLTIFVRDKHDGEKLSYSIEAYY